MTTHPELTVYYAYPIDQSNRTEAEEAFLVQAWEMLRYHFGVGFTPGDGFSVTSDAVANPYVSVVNTHAARNADVVVAVYPKGTVSYGVPIEIDRAVCSGKLTLVLTEGMSWMMQYPVQNLVVFDLTSPYVLDDVTKYLMTEDLTRWAKPRWRGEQEFVPRMDLNVTVGEGATLPRQTYPNDAGFDLFTSKDVVVEPDEFMDVPFDVAVQLPPGTWGMLTGRSSTLRSRGLHVATGIIDEGYRGPLFAGVRNLRTVEQTIEAGSRIAQFIILPNLSADYLPVKVDKLDETSRGTKGFGSSGR